MTLNAILWFGISGFALYWFYRGFGGVFVLGDIPMAIYYLGAGMFGWRVIIYTGRFITTRLIEVFSLSSDIASGIALIPSMISLCIYLGFVTMLGEKWMKHGTRLGYLRLFRIDSDD